VTRAGLLIGAVWVAAVLTALVSGARPTHLAFGWITTTGASFLVPLAFWGAAWGLGSALLRRLLPDFGREDRGARTLLATGLGWGALQILAEILGVVGSFGRAGAATMLAGGLILASLEVRRRGRAPPEPLAPITPAAAFAWATFAALLAPTLLAVGAPPLAADEILYHLRLAENLVETGRHLAHPGDIEASFAQGLHSMLALPMSLAGPSSARPFALLFALAALITGERIARRAFGSQAAALFLPLAAGAASVVRFAPGVSTDWPVGFFLGLGVLLMLDWMQAPTVSEGRPWILAILGGTALSIKYTAPLFFAPLFLVLGLSILGATGPRSERLRASVRLIAAAALCAAFALPWLIGNVIHYGHPFHPFVGMAIPAGEPGAWVFNFTANYGAGEGWKAALSTPWELFTMGREFDRRLFLGRLNPWPLLALPAILALTTRSRPGRALAVVAGLAFLAWMGPLRRVSYLLPLWPTIAALTAGGIAFGIERAPQRARGVLMGLLLGLLAASGVIETASPRVDATDDADVATGVESWDQFKLRRSAVERAHGWIRRNVPSDQRVAMFFVSKAYGIPNPTVFAGAEEMTPLRIALARAGSPRAMAEQLAEWDCSWVLRRAPFFTAEQYPMLTDREFETGFTTPVEIADGLLAQHGVLRFSDGPYAIYELKTTLAGERPLLD
jgi:hypothetical protein